MSKKELTLTKENTLSFTLNQDIKTNNNLQNNYTQKEFSQIFNKIYDSNFLVIINELSSQIQSFYKSSNTQFNIIKSFFSNNEDKQLSEIQKSFNTIEILISQFYSIAKVLFKKMKIYRNEKMKSIYPLSSTRVHKRSQTILFDKEKNKIPLLLNLDNIKDNNNSKNNLISTNGGCDSERSQKNKNIINIDNISDSNVNINYNNSNNYSQSLNTTIDKESNIILIEDKNQYSNLLIEYSDNLFKDIKSLEDTILSKEIVNKDDDDKIINIINSIKKIGNSIKDNISIYNLSNDNHDKKIVNDLSNKINLLSEENITIKKQFEKYKNEEKIKRKFFENQILNLSNKISDYEKNKKNAENKLKEMNNKLEEELNTKNKEILSLQKIINDYKDKTKDKNDLIIEKNPKGSERTNDDIHKIKKLNDKYNNVVAELEKENKEINDLLIQCENEKKSSIDMINKELENKNELIQEYKNKYENEIKKNNILESKLKDINNINEDDGNMTEYETKKIRKKIPIPKRRNNIDDNNEVKEVEKKFKFLYKTMNNFYKNKSRNILPSLYNSNNTSNSSMANDTKLSNNYNMNSSMKRTDILNYSNKKEKINNSYNDEGGRNIDTIDNKISPDNYSIVKVYQLNNKLKWILFRKNKKINEMKYIRYSLGNNSKDQYDYTYNDYIWKPYRTDNDFNEFGDISLFIEKEKEYNNIIIKLNQKNKAQENYIEKLKIENYSLNNIISKYKSEIKEDKNLIGVSFIEDDPESSKFIDDKLCEDILKGLDKNKENMKNKTSCYNINLKNSIDMLMTKVIPSENVRSLISSILRQLGCSDEDIYRLIGYHRGAISIPFSINKHGVK